MFLAGISLPGCAMELFVAPDGIAANSGARDSPISFEAALSRASIALTDGGLPDDGLRITLLGGRYPFTSTCTPTNPARQAPRDAGVRKAIP